MEHGGRVCSINGPIAHRSCIFSTGVCLMSANVALAQEGAEGINSVSAATVFVGAVAVILGYAVFLRWIRKRAAKITSNPPSQKGIFSDAELSRYSRHIILREIGGDGQRKLKAARVAVVGAGGLGSPALFYLAASGVGKLSVIDDDRVEVSNLQRQIIHTDESIGQLKAQSAVQTIKALNPHIEVVGLTKRLDKASLSLLKDHDLVLDGTDNFQTRGLINEYCAELRIPLVSGAIGQWEGQVTIADPGNGFPCLACLFPVEPNPESVPSCAEAGVAAALPGVIGSIMAGEAVKLLTGAGQPLLGELLIFDALWGETRKVKFDRVEHCPVCSKLY